MDSATEKNWRKYVLPIAGSKELRLLEIGVGNGESADWLLENILTGLKDRYVGIDPWPNEYEEVAARTRLTKASEKVVLIRGTPQCVAGREEPGSGPGFYLVEDNVFLHRVDVIHYNHAAQSIALLQIYTALWPPLLEGGIIVWSSYRGRRRHHKPEVMRAIDALAAEGKYQILVQNHQCIIKKTRE